MMPNNSNIHAKMKHRSLLFILMLTFIVFALPACQKRAAFKQEKGENSEDNRNVMDILTGATQDANSAAGSVAAISGRLQNSAATLLSVPCGSTLDTNLASSGILTVNYDGTTVCDNRVKSGSIRMTLLNLAAVLKMDFINFRVRRTSDNNSVLINGSVNFTNVNGGTIVEMIFGLNNVASVVHKAEGNGLSITFDDGSVRTLNISRKVTYTFPAFVFTVKIEGAGSYNGLTNVESWGQTRAGDPFTSQITEPLIANTNCYLWKPVAGKAVLKVDADGMFELTTTLGVDIDGNIISPNSGNCPWGYKIEWSYRNRTNDRLISYY
jgi:hypothetical protein